MPGALPSVSKPLLLTPSASTFIQFNDRVLFPVYTLGDESAQDRADLTNLRLADALRNLSDNEASGPAASGDGRGGGTGRRCCC